LPPSGHVELQVQAWAEIGDADQGDGERMPIDAERPAAMHRAWRRSTASIETPHLFAQRAIDRALADLRVLLNSGPGEDERYIAAGVPWFGTLFGRDSLINSLQLLPVRPQVAQQILSILARLQAT